jgi:hypothetical protein
MTKLLTVLVLSFSMVLVQNNSFTQKKEKSKIEKKAEGKETTSKNKGKKETTQKSEDPVVGKTKDGKPVYEGARGGFYYLTESGNTSYVNDFVGAKIVGKTADGLPIYEGPRGGRFYYSASGEKVYVKK